MATQNDNFNRAENGDWDKNGDFAYFTNISILCRQMPSNVDGNFEMPSDRCHVFVLFNRTADIDMGALT